LYIFFLQLRKLTLSILAKKDLQEEENFVGEEFMVIIYKTAFREGSTLKKKGRFYKGKRSG